MIRAAILAVLLLTTAAHAGDITAPDFDKKKATTTITKQVPVATPAPPVVQIRPAGNPPAKKVTMGEQILRGGIVTFGVSVVVGVIKLGMLLIGIPIL
jgi:hypothetical protein